MIETILDHQIPLRIESREGDYSENPTKNKCCIVLENKETTTAIALYNEGFEPSYPCRLLFIDGKLLNLGMDCAWFASLEDAVRQSRFWQGDNPHNKSKHSRASLKTMDSQ